MENEPKEEFIFDESKIVQKKHFAVGMFKDHHYFGIILSKDIEVKPKTGEIKKKQIMVPVIVLSNHTYYEITEEFQERHNLRFSEQPLMDRNRWTLKEVEDFVNYPGVLQEGYHIPNFEKSFHEIKELYQKYVHLEEEFYDLHAIWDIATYLSDCFDAFPYIELNGLKGTGKSKVMRISEKISFNGMLFISPTPATLFRFVERNKPTLYLDEAEKLFKDYGKKSDSADIVEMLNAGYTKSGKVPRMDKDEKGKFILKSFDVYGPKMLASIAGMQGALKDRCITEVMVKPSKTDTRGDLEPSDNDSTFITIRNKLYPLALKNAGAVKLQYHNLPKDFKLSNRDWQLWKPLLTIAMLISKEVYERLGKFAEKMTLNKEEVLEEDSWDFKIIEAVRSLLSSGDLANITVSGIKNCISCQEKETKPSNGYIGKFLNRVGFGKYRKRTGKGVYYELKTERFENILTQQDLVTQTTLVTQVTPEERMVVEEEVV